MSGTDQQDEGDADEHAQEDFEASFEH
jgi:hypothetical protein